MAEEVVFTAEGAASINEADASPKPAFADMKNRLTALGITDANQGVAPRFPPRFPRVAILTSATSRA